MILKFLNVIYKSCADISLCMIIFPQPPEHALPMSRSGVAQLVFSDVPRLVTFLSAHSYHSGKIIAFTSHGGAQRRKRSITARDYCSEYDCRARGRRGAPRALRFCAVMSFPMGKNNHGHRASSIGLACLKKRNRKSCRASRPVLPVEQCREMLSILTCLTNLSCFQKQATEALRPQKLRKALPSTSPPRDSLPQK